MLYQRHISSTKGWFFDLRWISSQESAMRASRSDSCCPTFPFTHICSPDSRVVLPRPTPTPPFALSVHRRRRAQLNDGYGSLLWNHRAPLSRHLLAYAPSASICNPSLYLTPSISQRNPWNLVTQANP
ncbi:hypothetical protein C8J57DRAFT_1705910 [Mycena rebaudengoi]|nr:hypothetical protein C8J57DRAFT_1705910 [Mycena rebaudengoi]